MRSRCDDESALACAFVLGMYKSIAGQFMVDVVLHASDDLVLW